MFLYTRRATLKNGNTRKAMDFALKITEKAKVLAELKKSFDFLRTTFANTPDGDFEKSVKMFNDMTTERGVYVTILTHLHEHLGQSIAYARMNGVVPPWSTKE